FAIGTVTQRIRCIRYRAETRDRSGNPNRRRCAAGYLLSRRLVSAPARSALPAAPPPPAVAAASEVRALFAGDSAANQAVRLSSDLAPSHADIAIDQRRPPPPLPPPIGIPPPPPACGANAGPRLVPVNGAPAAGAVLAIGAAGVGIVLICG